MEIRKTLILAAALAAGPNPPVPLRYETSCSLIDSSSADGFVTNESSDVYQVTGPVRFVFSAADSMSRPAIVYAANSAIPAGQTVRVARVKLAFQPGANETCRFEVQDAIRRP